MERPRAGPPRRRVDVVGRKSLKAAVRVKVERWKQSNSTLPTIDFIQLNNDSHTPRKGSLASEHPDHEIAERGSTSSHHERH